MKIIKLCRKEYLDEYRSRSSLRSLCQSVTFCFWNKISILHWNQGTTNKTQSTFPCLSLIGAPESWLVVHSWICHFSCGTTSHGSTIRNKDMEGWPWKGESFSIAHCLCPSEFSLGSAAIFMEKRIRIDGCWILMNRKVQNPEIIESVPASEIDSERFGQNSTLDGVSRFWIKKAFKW